MNRLITSKQEQIRALCQRHRVRNLSLFGSALRDDFEPGRSDIDLLVRFEDMPPGDYADAYFGLLEDLQDLFDGPVDLVTESSVTNPWLRREIEAHQSVLYAA